MSFEKVTDSARRVVVLAQEEARLLGSPMIEPEHLLIGLIHESYGLAAVVLAAMNVSLESIRSRLPFDPDYIQDGHIKFSESCKIVLAKCSEIPQERGLNFVGTEHIFLAVTSFFDDPNNKACSILVQLGYSQETMHAKINGLFKLRKEREIVGHVASKDRDLRTELASISVSLDKLRCLVLTEYEIYSDLRSHEATELFDAISAGIERSTLLTGVII